MQTSHPNPPSAVPVPPLRLRLGELGKLCVAIQAASTAELIERATVALADSKFIELRLDSLSKPAAALPKVAEFLASHRDATAIATCRRKEHGGAFTGSLKAELEVLAAAAEAGCQIVDLEVESAEEAAPRQLDQFRVRLRETRTALLISFHDFTRTKGLEQAAARILTFEPDFVKVFDFGLVKDISERHQEDLTRPGIFLGSPKYMAPEQFQRRFVDVRSDVYALGVVMYEMVTGRTPFEGPTVLSVLRAHANEPVPALRETNPEVGVSAGLEATIARALAKDPRDRLRSMGEFLAALDKLDAGPPGNRGGSARRGAAARRQRGAYLAALVALVGVGLVIATFFALR